MRNVCELFSSFPYLMKEAEFGERERDVHQNYLVRSWSICREILLSFLNESQIVITK